MTDRAVIRLGDCIEVLRSMPNESVDAVVCDPPYLLAFMGREFDKQDGAHADPRKMQTWHLAWAREALRVARPGAFLLAAGGDRTHHRLACALEDAGWEIRTTICHLFGSGFPKSLDVGKAIDKAAGAEREVVGPPPYTRGASAMRYSETRDVSWNSEVQPITAPATDAARQWTGFGTALKPAAEFWTVARKPLIGSVAQNVLVHGTGALNIDGCRVAGPAWSKQDGPAGSGFNDGKFLGASGHGEPTRRGEPSADRRYADEGGADFAATPGPRGGDAKGRWPSNVIFSHVGPDPETGEGGCVRVGTRRVKGITGGDSRTALGLLNDDGWEAKPQARQGYADADGLETVKAWCCAAVYRVPATVVCDECGREQPFPVLDILAPGQETTESIVEIKCSADNGVPITADGCDARFEVDFVRVRWLCPVAELDRQSGTRTSGRMKAGQKRQASIGKGGYGDGFPDEATAHDTPGDSGGVSRFFPTFDWSEDGMDLVDPATGQPAAPFRYVAKAPPAERYFYCRVCAAAFSKKSVKDHEHDEQKEVRVDAISFHPT